MNKGCVKGCLVAVGLAFFLGIAAIATIYYLGSKYETQSKSPGEGELFAAATFIQGYNGKEGAGNSPEATEFAEEYARKLRISREVLFTEGKKDAVSMSKGYFLTYCFAKDDSVAIVVHVPELRRYAEDAKVSLAEYAWMLATSEARVKFPKATKLALGIKGVLNYSAIYTGLIEAGEDPIRGIQTRHPAFDDEALWPYFTSAKEANQKAEPTKEGAGALPNPTPQP